MNSNRRILRFKNIDSMRGLKTAILEKLKINDFRKDCLPEFETRMHHYLDRNSSLILELELQKSQIVKRIRSRLEAENRNAPFPESFEFGNPLNRWIGTSITRTEEEAEAERAILERKIKNETEGFFKDLNVMSEYFDIVLKE